MHRRAIIFESTCLRWPNLQKASKIQDPWFLWDWIWQMCAHFSITMLSDYNSQKSVSLWCMGRWKGWIPTLFFSSIWFLQSIDGYFRTEDKLWNLLTTVVNKEKNEGLSQMPAGLVGMVVGTDDPQINPLNPWRKRAFGGYTIMGNRHEFSS